MIKANEIRIGNLVQIGDDKDLQGSVMVINKTSSDVQYEELNPIPLTEEWLLKFGFITLDAEPDFMEYGIKGVNFSICNDGGLDNHDAEPFYFEYGTDYPYAKREIKYVHQLQNLYFALMEEELAKSTQ